MEKVGIVSKLDGSDGFGVDWDKLTEVVESVVSAVSPENLVALHGPDAFQVSFQLSLAFPFVPFVLNVPAALNVPYVLCVPFYPIYPAYPWSWIGELDGFDDD